MAERVYCSDPQFKADGVAALTIEGDEARHLCRVRRVGNGAIVEVFNGRGFARQAELIEVGNNRVSLRLFGPPLPDRQPSLRVILATAVPKGDRFDSLIEKAVELGVSEVVPILSERSVVDPRASKLERLRRTIIEAAKQCGRNQLMTLGEPKPWPDLVRSAPTEALRFVAHPGGLSFPGWPRPVGSALVAVGPEGGLTRSEVDMAAEAGWVTVSLGATLLRIETAALVASARLLALAELSLPEKSKRND